MTDNLRVYEIEARTRYRIAGHSAAAALERLHALDECTAFDVDGDVDIQFIASCSVPEDTIVDVTDEYLGECDLHERHRDGCDVCQT